MTNSIKAHTESLLVIEDDAEIFEWTKACLETAGYSVFCEPDAGQVSGAINRDQPDLVMLDLGLQNAAPLELLQQINTDFPGLPVILIFDEAVEDMMVDALRFHIVDYLLKPMRSNRLMFSIHAGLVRGRLERENASYHEQLENANRELQMRLDEMQSDQQAGRLVQRKMLPRTPFEIFGYQFEHLILPANYLAGDFVDYHQVSDDKLVFFLVDVTGHGAASAFVTVLVKQLAQRSRRHFKKDQIHDVRSAGWMLSWINRSLLEADIDCHLTIFLGVIDDHEKTLNYSYGGQFPQAIFSSPDTTCYLAGRGLPVGLFEDASYEDYTIELPPEFSIDLFSDGILEIMPEQSLALKEERLLKIVANGGSSLNSVYEQLGLEEIEHAPDDISVLTIHHGS